MKSRFYAMQKGKINMKLTKAQQKVVDRFNELEAEHGKGNVFLRYINECWNVMFVWHKKGEQNIGFKLCNENKVNGRILNSLENMGLLQGKDSEHNDVADSNSAKYEDKIVLGSIITI